MIQTCLSITDCSQPCVPTSARILRARCSPGAYRRRCLIWRVRDAPYRNFYHRKTTLRGSSDRPTVKGDGLRSPKTSSCPRWTRTQLVRARPRSDRSWAPNRRGTAFSTSRRKDVGDTQPRSKRDIFDSCASVTENVLFALGPAELVKTRYYTVFEVKKCTSRDEGKKFIVLQTGYVANRFYDARFEHGRSYFVSPVK